MPLASFDPASGTESSYQGDFVIFSYAMESVFIGCLVSEKEKRIAIDEIRRRQDDPAAPLTSSRLSGPP
jgi:hypothetical protein